MTFTKEFKLLVKAKYPLIYVVSIEEDRVEYSIKIALRNSNLTRAVYVWDFIDGYKGNPNNIGFGIKNPLQALELVEKLDSDQPAIFILKDFHLFLNDTSVLRKLKNLAKTMKNQLKTIVIIGSEFILPDSIKDSITVLEFTLPESAEIRLEILRLQRFLGLSLPENSLGILTRLCQGLSLEKIRKVFSKIIVTYKEINVESFTIIFEEKRQFLNQTNILEFYKSTEKLSSIGGLENLKSWLHKRVGALSERAGVYGLPSPRGLFLVGVQGTGKSMTAKAIATEWRLPLLKLDMGRLFGSILGESESKMRQMISLSEAMSPCILWIDEVCLVLA